MTDIVADTNGDKFDTELRLKQNFRKLTASFAYLSAIMSFTIATFLDLPGISYGASPLIRNSNSNSSKKCIDSSTIYLMIFCILWYFHFCRRLYETYFVFKYYRVAQLWEVIFGIFYYGILGFWCAWSVNLNILNKYNCYPNCVLIIIGLLTFIIGEFGNGYHHFLLKNMRPKGVKKHVIPTGGCFKYVSAPHYFFELIAWFGCCIITGFSTGFVAIFVISLVTLLGLAKEKHDKLKTQFNGENGNEMYPKERKSLCPFLF